MVKLLNYFMFLTIFTDAKDWLTEQNTKVQDLLSIGEGTAGAVMGFVSTFLIFIVIIGIKKAIQWFNGGNKTYRRRYALLGLMMLMTIFATAATITPAYAYSSDSFESHTVTFDSNGGGYTHPYVEEFEKNIDDDKSMSLLFIGDSTGNEDDEWVHLLAEYFETVMPTYSVNYRGYDTVSGTYNNIDRLSVSSTGDGYALFDGSISSGISTESDISISGDLEISAKITINDYHSSDIKQIVNKLGATGSRGFEFYISPLNATPVLRWSANGTDLITATATTAATVVDGEALWYKVTLDVNNGASGYNVIFYTSSDGITWTKLGDTVTGAGVTSVNNNTSALSWGNRGGVGMYEGKFYEGEIRDGIGSSAKVITNINMGLIESGVNQFKDAEGNEYIIVGNTETGFGGPELTIYNGHISGGTISTFMDETTYANVVVGNPEMTFISLSHNEIYSSDIIIYYNNLLTYLSNEVEDNFVLVGQNPKTDPQVTESINLHELRIDAIGTIAADYGYGYIDAFNALSTDLTTNIESDGVHPTSAGSILWKNEVVNYFQGAFGDGTEKFTMEILDNHQFALPANPKNDGYDFAGWYKDSALTEEFDEVSDVITEDIILYAKWVEAGTLTDTTGFTLVNGLMSFGATVLIIFALLFIVKKGKGRKSYRRRRW